MDLRFRYLRGVNGFDSFVSALRSLLVTGRFASSSSSSASATLLRKPRVQRKIELAAAPGTVASPETLTLPPVYERDEDDETASRADSPALSAPPASSVHEAAARARQGVFGRRRQTASKGQKTSKG